MPLEPGSKLGQYEILSSLGAGGMGEVYRARDPKLGRDVAIKVLRDDVANDPERLARFEREARVLASLNHPHIGGIHGLEEADGQKALVLELVEGPTLADRIAQGPIPVDEAVAIARQIAEALEAAHSQGIVHRDLKPANVKLRPDGPVKVLDFGLAKAREAVAPEGDPDLSPTLTAAATQMGVILGTAAYMSPEQARGKPVDKRADVWALGVVLFEMLTGRRPFEGEDVSMTLSSVLQREPDFELLPPDLPPSLEVFLRRSLEKDPRQRVQDAGDLRLAMEGAFETASLPAPASTPRLQIWQRPIPAALGALALLALGGLAMWSWPSPEAARSASVTRTTLGLPSDLRLAPRSGRSLALSADGGTVVFSATDAAGATRLYLRRLDQFDVTPLRDTEDPRGSPFLSPDGEWVGFASEGALKKVSVRGGSSQTLTTFPGRTFYGAIWGPDDRIIAAWTGGLWRISAAGGEAEPLLTPATTDSPENFRPAGPHLLPGGTALVFHDISTRRLELLRLDTQERRVLLEDAGAASYVDSGHLVFGRDSTIWAVPFDVERLQLAGNPFPLVEGVLYPGRGIAPTQFAVSLDGTLAYTLGSPLETGGRTLVWVDRTGREEPIPIEPGGYLYPSLSPDGTSVALSETPYDIWLWSFARQVHTRVTFDEGGAFSPAWTPDGKTLLFASSRHGGSPNVYQRLAGGTGDVERVSEHGDPQRPFDVSPDGGWLVVGEFSGATDGVLARLSLVDGRREVLVDNDFETRNADLSQDGNWMAYEAAPSGTFEVFVRAFHPGTGGLQQVSTRGGRMPRWSPDGREIFYWGPTRQMMAVPVETGESSLTLGRPEVLFEGDYFDGNALNIGRTFDIAPDGQRFLMIKEAATEGPDHRAASELRIIQNLFQNLTQSTSTQ